MLEIQGLTKRYGAKTVVDDLSFRCEAGEVLGFLGPNGAGKSTTMKMITGFLAPDGGSAKVCGKDIRSDTIAAQRHIGYLPEGAPLYPDMTPRKFLSFIADVRGLEGAHRRESLGIVVDQLHLDQVLDQRIETLSKGFILDEPTDGLDPNQKHEVRELIRSMSADKLVIISTHILEEVGAVCSRAMIIANGRLLEDDTPDNLRERGDGSLQKLFRDVTQGGLQ